MVAHLFMHLVHVSLHLIYLNLILLYFVDYLVVVDVLARLLIGPRLIPQYIFKACFHIFVHF